MKRVLYTKSTKMSALEYTRHMQRLPKGIARRKWDNKKGTLCLNKNPSDEQSQLRMLGLHLYTT